MYFIDFFNALSYFSNLYIFRSIWKFMFLTFAIELLSRLSSSFLFGFIKLLMVVFRIPWQKERISYVFEQWSRSWSRNVVKYRFSKEVVQNQRVISSRWERRRGWLWIVNTSRIKTFQSIGKTKILENNKRKNKNSRK